MRLVTLLVLGITASAAAPVTRSTPSVFAPGVISRAEHEAALAFAPDGRSVYFQESDGTNSRILVSRVENGQWSSPELAPFSGRWSDMEPAMAADGSYIIFVSNRPTAPGGKPIDGFFGGQVQPGGGGNLWRVDRTPGGWGEPYRLPESVNVGSNVFAPSILRDGSLLFMRTDPATGKFRIYRSQHGAGGYATARPMPFSTGAVTDVDPVADRDETFIIFGSGRAPADGMDLFLVRRSGVGWGLPQHLGALVNAPGSDAEPRLSADEKRLYFSSERRLTDAKGEVQPGDWNNGKYNIWTIDLDDLPVPAQRPS